VLIVDAQVHIWTASTPERPWPPIVHPTQSRPHKAEPITTEIMLQEMDAAGVDRAVIAPPVWVMGRGLCEWIGWKTK
jgi:predicted TIM-barrel fold metal-dependent hydrolase